MGLSHFLTPPGPILFAREMGETAARLTLLSFTEAGAGPPMIDAAGGQASDPAEVLTRAGLTAWLCDLTLPVGPGVSYCVDGTTYPVATDLTGDCRIAFVSCNGREHDDAGRDPAERNAMWRRLAADHAEAPLGLLMQGGDQIYADEVLTSHPVIAEWHDAKIREKHAFEMTPEMVEAARDWLFRRYIDLMSAPKVGALMATVPTVAVWDDHDIIDGWGSHPAPVQESAVGQGLFAVATEMFRLFQRGLPPTDEVPAEGFPVALRIPGAAILAPDLRATRTRQQLMGEAGWQAFEQSLAALPHGLPVIMVSSVPLLGPRLSWVEALMNWLPGLQRYEDDLRDQWQSKAHRTAWQRMLRLLEREMVDRARPITVLSGEIHLATRGEMRLPSGDVLHQLVAPGISHPEPPALYPRLLGLLAQFGEAPLEGRPISLHPLPGRRWIYTRERNWLILQRSTGHWRAQWETERQGTTGWLALPSPVSTPAQPIPLEPTRHDA